MKTINNKDQKKEHTGFCLSIYKKEDCHNCPAHKDCLKLKDSEAKNENNRSR